MSIDRALSEDDIRLMRQFPSTEFVPNVRVPRSVALRMARIRTLVTRGLVQGEVLDRVTGGHQYRVTLTDAGHAALTAVRLAEMKRVRR